MEGFKDPGTEERTYEIVITVKRDDYVEDVLYDYDGDKPDRYSFLNGLMAHVKSISGGDKGTIHWYIKSVTDKT